MSIAGVLPIISSSPALSVTFASSPPPEFPTFIKESLKSPLSEVSKTASAPLPIQIILWFFGSWTIVLSTLGLEDKRPSLGNASMSVFGRKPAVGKQPTTSSADSKQKLVFKAIAKFFSDFWVTI